MLIVISIMIIGIFYLITRIHTHNLQVELAKQRIELQRLRLAELSYKKNTFKYQSLYEFALRTKDTVELSVDNYLSLFAPITNYEQPKTNVDVELKQIVSTKKINKTEFDLLMSFIELQRNVLLIKNPLRFYRIYTMAKLKIMPIYFIASVFNVFINFGAKLNFLTKDKYFVTIGKYRIESIKEKTNHNVSKVIQDEKQNTIHLIDNMEFENFNSNYINTVLTA